MKKYKEDIEKNELFDKIQYLSVRAFSNPNCLNYELENIRKESVKARIKHAQQIREICKDLSKEEIIDLITLGYK
jgi:hypothetical protein